MQTIFKPAPQFKELMVLTLISKNKSITQRDIAGMVGVSLAMVNEYLDKYENEGLIERKYYTKKIVEYLITKKGRNRIKFLNISYMESSIDIFKTAKKEMNLFLENLQSKYKNIILYGAGEVASTILFVIDTTPSINLNIVALVDDDEEKIGTNLVDRPIISYKDINQYDYDCVFISTYSSGKEIYKKLKKNNFDMSKVVNFFD